MLVGWALPMKQKAIARQQSPTDALLEIREDFRLLEYDNYLKEIGLYDKFKKFSGKKNQRAS